MELSSEDSFRLNVLLASKPEAIRVDEGKMTVHGLGPKGESTVRLHPSGRPEQYVRLVRELISGHVLGSPGGYPVYLRRWTRMGQMRDESLAQLLLLGEPEAVVAAVCSPGLTDELARRAWWAMEDAENARRMLCNPAIVRGEMGPILAAYLIDYLPFETEAERIMESIRLILQPGLVSAAQREELWRKSARKQTYLVGFLQGLPDGIPEVEAPLEREPRETAVLETLAGDGNPCAQLLLRIGSGPGQAWLKTVSTVLAKPPNQEVVTTTFDCLREYLAPLRPEGDPNQGLSALEEEAAAFATVGSPDPATGACLSALPALADRVAAMRLLSGLGYGVIRPVLPDPSTQGTLMRRKLAPVIEPVLERLSLLRGGRT